ncbi:MAG: nitroreductase family protein [Dysgonomonas sp.]|nr:nitroreductase family protein [Dysgonomonas sp.]
MNFLELVNKRKSVRQYSTQELEQEKLDYILECARLAPSACNLQPWHFFVVKSEEGKKMLQECYPREWFISNPTPVYILACANTEQSWKRSYDNKDHCDIDVSITFEHICLAAAEQGLGTCWICHFDPAKTKELFNLPDHLHPVAITPLGYPAKDEPNTPKRKEKDEIISFI